MSSNPTIPTPGNFPLRTPPFEGASGVDSLRFALPWVKWLQAIEVVRSKATQFFSGTHAQRLNLNAARFPNGSTFEETDRSSFYVIINGQWQFLSGSMIGFVTKGDVPFDLGTADTGFLFFAIDFAHQLQWTGTNWQWGPNEVGSGSIRAFVNPPNPPTGWQACDGSANVQQLNPDSSISLVTVPNIPGSFFRT
jgi:hypothetical protein